MDNQNVSSVINLRK